MSTQVSVVVATYRRDTALKDALESLSKQRYKDFEIVLVDDNGNAEWNEKVGAIVDDFKKNHPDIELNYIVNNPNQGSAKARNAGIDSCRGELITFLDDDDVYLEEKINRQAEFMLEGGYDYSVTDLDLYNENEKLIDKRTRSYIKETTQSALLEYHFKYHLTGTDTMMFKKEYLLEIGKFAPIDVGDEFYLMQRAVDGGGKFGYLPGCDVKAYVHTGEGNLSSGESKINGENALHEYKKTYFDKLSSKNRRYIRMRHYAVLAFAYLRLKKYGKFFGNGFLSFINAPFACIGLLKNMR